MTVGTDLRIKHTIVMNLLLAVETGQYVHITNSLLSVCVNITLFSV